MTDADKGAEVNHILDDPDRTPEQKLDAIREVLRPRQSRIRGDWNPDDDPAASGRGRAWRPPHQI
ncbi:hypothetical protein [Kribbella sp. NPDC048928]|uniref:hypothetical protein n=1 Tax=Kribbella sp. NPDC048928 TaxID=3364111 RepID=UPI0037125A67